VEKSRAFLRNVRRVALQAVQSSDFRGRDRHNCGGGVYYEMVECTVEASLSREREFITFKGSEKRRRY
jgi:hypothetical protein